MEPIYWIVIAVLVAVVILFALWKFNSVDVTGEGGGFKGRLKAEGRVAEEQVVDREKHPQETPKEVKNPAATKIEASGAGAVAIGSAENATVTTNVTQDGQSKKS